jgi:Fe-S oxidoreductase
MHHTQLIQELISNGKIQLASLSPDDDLNNGITYHDPCYLGRHNHIVDEPRADIRDLNQKFTELPRHAYKSFCCGAGGAQMWKEEEHGQERINANRFAEAQATGADALAVACPFCLIMLTDAKKAANSEMQVLDIAELVAARLE